jgi:hypothetical protein
MQIDVSKASKEELVAAYLAISSANQRPGKQFQSVIQSKDENITILENCISWFRRQIFGAKSERLIPQDPK